MDRAWQRPGRSRKSRGRCHGSCGSAGRRTTISAAPAGWCGCSSWRWRRPSRWSPWPTGACSCSRPLLALDQLDLVAVGILDESDHRGAELNRAGRARDLAAGLGDLLAHAVDVGHADGEVAEAGAQFVGLLLPPVVGQLDGTVLALVAVADEGQGVLAGRHVTLAQQLHAHRPGIESERFVEILHPDHRVQHAVVGGGIGHQPLLYCRSRIMAAKVASAATLPSTNALPENFQTLARLCTFSTCNSRRSPGTTGRRKRTPSIDMK